jgi:sulfite reductase (NADPH) flavoprotein alpha-component
MAKDVEQIIIRIIQEFGGKTLQAAQVYLDTLAKAGRYQKDVY